MYKVIISAKAINEVDRAKMRHDEEVALFAKSDSLESTYLIVEGHKRQSLNDKRKSLV